MKTVKEKLEDSIITATAYIQCTQRMLFFREQYFKGEDPNTMKKWYKYWGKKQRQQMKKLTQEFEDIK